MNPCLHMGAISSYKLSEIVPSLHSSYCKMNPQLEFPCGLEYAYMLFLWILIIRILFQEFKILPKSYYFLHVISSSQL